MRSILCIVLMVILGWTNAVSAAMTSTNYQIPFDSLNSGGTDFSSSTNFNMNDTLGEQATGYGTSTNFMLHAGYRQSDENAMIALDVGAQENLTQTAYTAFQSSGPATVTVASTTSFATSSHISVVENRGLTQKLAVGKITGITGNVITVDKWDGDNATMSAVPAGGDDFAFRTDGSAVQFGTLIPLVGTTSNVHTEVTTNASTGYTLHVYSDGYLRTLTNHIKDVTDGLISGDAEEYGASVVGVKAVGVGSDFAVTTTHTLIQTSAGPGINDRIGMNYKIFIVPATLAGSYTQHVTYLLTANF